jgi:trimethylamine---corrinoid protein Co-methyltransferase
MNDLLARKITTETGETYPQSPMLPLSSDDITKIHDASLQVLSQTGVTFASEKALELFKKNGFRVEGRTVFFTEKEINTALETATKQFTILARNPSHNIEMKAGITSFGMGRGAVYMVEPDGNHRVGTSEDAIQVAKLFQDMDLLEHYNPLIFPSDVDSKNVQLWMCRLMIEYTDKPYIYTGREDIELIALAHGTTPEKMAERTDMSYSYGRTTGLATSPLSFPENDVENIIAYAEHGIAFHIASMPISCTSGPCTLAGLVVQQNCENLAPIVLSQLVKPGCPIFYGAIGGSADMKTLRPRFGSVEAMLSERCGVQMARSYGLLCRGGAGLTDAPSCDFQAGAQAMLNTLSVIYDGPNFIPACGLLGSYMGASLAKVVLDEELIIKARRFLSPIKTDESSLAVDVIHEVGPGGYFIEHEHTLNHFRYELDTESIFHSPDYHSWAAGGKKNANHIAYEKALKLIGAYEPPPMDRGLKEEIEAYVNRHWI